MLDGDDLKIFDNKSVLRDFFVERTILYTATCEGGLEHDAKKFRNGGFVLWSR